MSPVAARTRPPFVALLALAASVVPREAAAGAADHDVELVRPRFGAGAFAGVDDPTVQAPGSVRAALTAQYEHDPVLYYANDHYFGAAVGERLWGSLGAGFGVLRWLDLGVGLPVAYTFASDDTTYTADGAAVGDLVTTARARVVQTRAFGLLVRAEANWPVGTRDAWMSDPTVRPALALVAGLHNERLRGNLDVGVLGRPEGADEAHWTVSTEVNLGASLAWVVVPARLDLNYALLTRVGTATPQALPSRSVELLMGVTGHPGRGVDVTAGGGVGLSGGVGVPVARGLLDVRWTPQRKVVATPEAVVVEADLPEAQLPPEPPPAAAPPGDWAEGQLARVEASEITIRDPIQFEFGKEVILPESKPTLEAVAALLRTDGRILHVVIQGHASDEGSFIYNYDLSSRRARAVWEALVSAGVHPDRISYQGMGEVVPVRAGTDEAALAANRRVVFRIVRLLEPGETAPALPTTILLPWNGEAHEAVTPPPPPAPAPPPEDDDE